MSELDSEHQEPENEGPEDELVELPDEEPGTEELKGKQIITLLTVIVAAANIVAETWGQTR
ncbi:MAG: hypothetical protein GY721_06190 [Deltaproteobacteria bacterium]|nr:hypothetical protein [Deltaproteobacteria bacterium]